MSGPIVRSGPSPEFSKNWARAFGQGKKSKASTKKAAKSKAKASKKK